MTHSFDVLSTVISIFCPSSSSSLACCFKAFTLLFFFAAVVVSTFPSLNLKSYFALDQQQPQSRRRKRHWNEMYSSRINLVYSVWFESDTHCPWTSQQKWLTHETKKQPTWSLNSIDDISFRGLTCESISKFNMTWVFSLSRCQSDRKHFLNFVLETHVSGIDWGDYRTFTLLGYLVGKARAKFKVKRSRFSFQPKIEVDTGLSIYMFENIWRKHTHQKSLMRNYFRCPTPTSKFHAFSSLIFFTYNKEKSDCYETNEEK